MGCNKDEAIRAMSIAESKLQQKDFSGAKKFALKAQALYPGFHGISQMLTTIDVLYAENNLSGEVDWYGVLGVNPSADDDAIKQQFRKLALLLHPDKNTSAGADGAFKLISEARGVLLDKEKRAAYDEKKGYKQKVPKPTGGPSTPSWPHPSEVPAYNGRQSAPPQKSQKKAPSAPPRPNQKKAPVRTSAPSAPPQPSRHKAGGHTSGASVPIQPSVPSASPMENQFFSFASWKTSILNSQKRNAEVPSTPNPAPSHQTPDTFWTICGVCYSQYEYLRIFRSHILLCRKCVKPFLALEIAGPVNFSKLAEPVSRLRQKRSFENLPGKNAYYPKDNVAASPSSSIYTNYQQYPLHGTADTDSRYPSSSEKPGSFVHLAHGNLKRSRTESQASAGCFNKGKLEDDSNRYGINHCMAQGTSDFAAEAACGM